jgi:hypothetical protein
MVYMRNMGCILTYFVVCSVRTVVKFASLRHTIAGKPCGIRDRGGDDVVTFGDGNLTTDYADYTENIL